MTIDEQNNVGLQYVDSKAREWGKENCTENCP